MAGAQDLLGLVQRACRVDGHTLTISPPSDAAEWWEVVITLGPTWLGGANQVAVGKGSSFGDALQSCLDEHHAVRGDTFDG